MVVVVVVVVMVIGWDEGNEGGRVFRGERVSV